ncbi:hypothetical protein NHX12_025572 [Muraenolepis orangiensis]|uniref:Uncharacterized protein n=1 Tax=Muraenolepis orangiensis TaxID=630683 RepID=A0A9Q0EN03_9TELE|nr:hypothetical protein NHX12_025572 [Muraenolepis orangiensis]
MGGNRLYGRGLVDFVSSLDTVLEEHLKTATVFKGTSKTVQNELLDSMLSVLREYILEEAAVGTREERRSTEEEEDGTLIPAQQHPANGRVDTPVAPLFFARGLLAVNLYGFHSINIPNNNNTNNDNKQRC